MNAPQNVPFVASHDPEVDRLLSHFGTTKVAYAKALQEVARRQERRLQAEPGGLMRFVRYFWNVLEPDTEFQEGWALEAIATHLEAVAAGAITRLLINVPPGSCKPVAEDELVLTKRGYVRLGDIEVGDLVVTHNGRLRSILAVHEQGILPVLRVNTFSGRSVRTAYDHPFLTARGWVKAKYLTTNDVLGIPRVPYDLGDDSMRPEEARLLGYLVGDGCISQRSLSFTNMDDEIIKDFIYCADICGFYSYITKHPNKNVKASRLVLKSSQTRIDKGDNEDIPVLMWLKKHGLYKSNSYTKFIPDAVFSSGPRAISNFIGAYWSCNGEISIRHSSNNITMLASATTVSERLAHDVQRALTILNIHTRIKTRVSKINSKKQENGRYISFNIVSSESDEVSKFANLPGLISRKSIKAGISTRKTFDCDIYSDPIISVEPDGEAKCRCLSVSNDETFTIDGLIVHNSLLSSVFFPLWCWSALGKPGLRFLALSYSASLTERDNRKMLHIIRSEKFRELYGKSFSLTKEGVELVVNDRTGQKQASSVGGTVTGARADIVILDDPNSIKEVESEVVRTETARFFREALSNRLNHMTKSAIVVIQQRSHEEDISGVILSEGLPYDHLCIPMLHELGRSVPTAIGWEDPREEEGECYWPERFPPEAIEEAKRMGDYAFAGQYMQRPAPRGGGIFRTEWWNEWNSDDGKYPPFDFIIASVDTAYTDKKQNDPTALVILGVNFDDDGGSRVFLIDAWRKHLPLHGPEVKREYGESQEEYLRRAKPIWGLVEWLAYSCKRWKISRLLIEGKASGLSVAQEMIRLMYHQSFAIDIINPGRSDKISRAARVQPFFAAGMIWHPARGFADLVIDEMASFPRGKHDDLTDCMTQGLWYLRENGWLERREERTFHNKPIVKTYTEYHNHVPLYPV